MTKDFATGCHINTYCTVFESTKRTQMLRFCLGILLKLLKGNWIDHTAQECLNVLFLLGIVKETTKLGDYTKETARLDIVLRSCNL